MKEKKKEVTGDILARYLLLHEVFNSNIPDYVQMEQLATRFARDEGFDKDSVRLKIQQLCSREKGKK